MQRAGQRSGGQGSDAEVAIAEPTLSHLRDGDPIELGRLPLRPCEPVNEARG